MSLLAAVLKRPAPERETFLQHECRGDLELLHEITKAMDWEERMGGFLREPLVACAEIDLRFQRGEVVGGRFEIIREAGEAQRRDGGTRGSRRVPSAWQQRRWRPRR